MKAQTRDIALSAVLIALGVALSPLWFPAGITKAFPFQHMVNAIAGVLLGPWYAALIALIIGSIRISIGLGTIFAYSGGIPGGFIVGIVYRYIKKSDYATLTEPIGTCLIGGALLSTFLFVPFVLPALGMPFKPFPPLFGIELPLWAAFAVFWAPSSIPGSVLGLIVVKMLRKMKIAEALFAERSHR